METMARESWTDDKLDLLSEKVDLRFEAVDRRFDAVDRRFDAVDRRFDRVDEQFKGIDRQFEEVDRRFGEVNRRLDSLIIEMRGFDAKLDKLNRSLLYVLISSISISVTVAGLIAAVAHS
jgi:archaellum component FlaC